VVTKPNTFLTLIKNPFKDMHALKEGVEFLKKDTPVAFATETVYGLGGNGLSIKAIHNIFLAKNRPLDNPLILHIDKQEWVFELTHAIKEEVQHLINHFWPGPLTLVLPKKKHVPYEVTAGSDFVALRMPQHPLALNLILECGFPLAAPSANLSGRPSPTTANMVYQDLKEKIPLILDGGPCEKGIESTVLDLSSKTPKILRPGSISYQQLKEFLPHLQKPLLKNFEKPNKIPSPGIKYPHYRPNIPIVLVKSPRGIKKALKTYQPKNPVLLSLTFKAPPSIKNFMYPHLESFASKLYYDFVALESKGYDFIMVEKIKEKGLGFALLNRLLKASEGVF